MECLRKGKRVRWEEHWEHLPLLAAAIIPTNVDPTLAEMATRIRANRNWMLEENGTSSVAFGTRGSIVLTTANSSGNDVNIRPHTATNQTILKAVTWRPDYEPMLEFSLQALDIAAVNIKAGFLLTSANYDITTDANQAAFLFRGGTDTTWRCITSVTGEDDENVDSEITVVDDTWYRFRIKFDATGVPYFYAAKADNDWQLLHYAANPITSSVTGLYPVIGVETGASATKDLGIGPLALELNLMD